MGNEDAESLINKGNDFYKAKNYEEAIKCYDIAAQLTPPNIFIFYNWGDALFNLSKNKKNKERDDLLNSALEKYEEIIKLDHKEVIAYYRCGLILSNLAENKKDIEIENLLNSAFEKYEEAVRLYEPETDKTSVLCDWGNVLYNLAKINEDESLFKKAFAKYYKAMQYSNSDNAVYAFANWGDALRDLAKINEDESLFNKAIKKYDEAIGIEPDNLWHIIGRGDALYDLAKIEQKEHSFRKVIDNYEAAPSEQESFWLSVGWADALYDLAKIEQKEHSFEIAIDKYDEAINIYNENMYQSEGKFYAFFKLGIALVNLAKINQNKDLYEKATDNFRKSKKNILEILTSLEEVDRKKLLKTNILHSLLDFDDNDTYFKEVTEKLTDKQRKKINEYKEVYIRSFFIISLLHVKDKNEKLVAHYLEKNISQRLLFDSNSKFRLNAINYSNDPKEGRTLLDFLYGKEEYKTDEELNNKEYEAFAGCFTFNYDSLNQFRLYGKEGDKEGTGLSLVFRNNFFNKEVIPALKSSKIDSSETSDYNYIEKDKFPLYRCIYIDPQSGTGQPIAVVGQKEESLFDKENMRDKFHKYNTEMNKITKRVKKEMRYLKDKAKNLDPVIVGKLLIHLRYLVKHIAFKEEQECRMVKIHNLNDKEIEMKDEYKQMYIKYSPAVPLYIDKIYFGPKAGGIELFKNMLKNKRLDHIPCEKSTNPLA